MSALAQRNRLVEIGDVARMLNARADQLARDLLPGGKRIGAEWVCGGFHGEPGTRLSVRIRGAKTGVWSNFATGAAGDALDLVAQARFGGDKRQALAWARGWLGLEVGTGTAALPPAADPGPEDAARAQAAADEAAQARSNALRVWLSARQVLRDTPVERYLAGRGIALAELGRAPRAIRFHPALWHRNSARHWPAMVTAVTAPDGAFCTTHRTWLELRADGSVGKAPVDPEKAVMSGYRGAAIRLWRGASGRSWRNAGADEVLDVTEGIEDGLSVVMAAPECRVCAAVALPNIAALEPPPGVRTLRIWQQRDIKPAAIEGFRRAVAAQQAAGRTVLLPPMPEGVKDVNDLLRAAALPTGSTDA